MNSFTIKDLANLSGIKAHTLRIWEQRYNFLKPNRTFTNIRYYNNEELKTILNISLLNKYGYKISHIDKMTGAEMNEKLLSLSPPEAQQETVVNNLIKHMIDLEMDAFENILNNEIDAKGIELTITDIIFSFLEKIGILWLTNHINPAQEHLVSNIIRQKLIAGIESLKTPAKSKSTVLLFLPEGEFHEIGLLFMHYLLKSRGVKVIYLGANIALPDVEYVVNHNKPDYLYCHLTSVSQNFDFDKFLQNLKQQFKNIPVVISGLLTSNYEKKLPASIIFKCSLADVMLFIKTL